MDKDPLSFMVFIITLLLESLSSNTSISDGFYNDTIGNSTDRVYGQALCRGDVNSTVCQNCVHDASQEIFKSCKTREAIIWYELCQVHYSFTTFFSQMVYTGKYPEKNSRMKSVSNPDRFKDVLKNLMTKLLRQTANDPSKHMFATGEMKFSGKKTIYGLQQCTRDISGSDCQNCLDSALLELQTCCSSHEGGTIVSRNCNMRFELYRFFNDIYSTGDKRKTWKVVVICASTILFVVLIVLCVVYLRPKKGFEDDQERSQHGLLPYLASHTGVTITEDDKMVSSEELPFFDLTTIRKATDDFSDSNKLGQGGFGAVYKGWLDGKEVAVKRLSRKSKQGLEEFKNEVNSLQSFNIETLCGFWHVALRERKSCFCMSSCQIKALILLSLIWKDEPNSIGKHITTLLKELQEDLCIFMRIPGLRSFTEI
ncbi:hypothetical protein M0R45_012996 [Rubus argutus]|uniref:Cysteine-rich receptor-like protein kinase 25 n=1 Tax=Rubus argutus TaxID=59490 RepID=A0AAW1XJX8_RUBAR